MATRRPQTDKGRGATANPAGRFATESRAVVDDGWGTIEEAPPRLETTLSVDHARSVIAWNDSPDVPFDRSINPYRGCEHGCIYCYARPSHAYLDLSPGQDFETRLFYKPDAGSMLDTELRKPGYRCQPITIGANTDPYQPVERRLGITRSVLATLARFRHPAVIITKNGLVVRDLDLLRDMAAENLIQVAVSVTTLDADIKRKLEPRTTAPASRLRTVRALAEAGIPVAVMVAPVIPAITDHEIEAIVAAAAEAGASSAGYVLLRLPHEVKGLFRDWLETHYPDRAAHVMSLVQQARGGRDNDSRFGHRMRGEGPYAELIRQRFRAACRRYGLDRSRGSGLDTSQFRPPPRSGDQLELGL